MKNYLPGDYFNIYDRELLKIYRNIEAPINPQETNRVMDPPPNLMHDVLSFKPSKYISKEQLETIHNQINQMIVSRGKTSSFTDKLKQEYKKALINKMPTKNSLLAALNEHLDIPQHLENCLLRAISYEDEIIAFKFERQIGMLFIEEFLKVLDRIYPQPQHPVLGFKNNLSGEPFKYIFNQLSLELEVDLEKPEAIKFLWEEMNLPTPRTSSATCFTSLLGGVLNHKLKYLILVVTLINALRNYLLMLPQKKDSEPKNSPMYSCVNKLLEGIRSILNSQNPNDPNGHHPDEVLARKLKYKLINIRNIYVKQLGMEAAVVLCDAGILSSYKKHYNKNYVIHYKLCSKLTVAQITHKLPELFLHTEVEYIKPTTVYTKDKNTLGVQYWNSHIVNDDMEGSVGDIDIWHNAQGEFTLNLDFTKEFLKNIYYIMKKVDKNAPLNAQQNHFLHHYLEFNLEYLKHAKDEDKLYKKVLSYAFNFKDLSKKKFYHKDICPRILLEARNKIYQRKFMLLQIISDLPILMSFENWKILIKFCARGRGYPSPSLFNHLGPIMKFFMGFSYKYRSLNKDLLFKLLYETSLVGFQLEQHLGSTVEEKTKLNNVLHSKQRGLRLIDVIDRKKPLELYLLVKDFKFWDDFSYRFQYYYSLDACGSGIQINAILLKNKKIALACGLISSDKGDFYTQFVTHFHQAMNARLQTSFQSQVPAIILQACKEFVFKYLLEMFNTNSLLKLFADSESLNNFLEIYKLLDTYVKKEDLLTFKRRYKSKIKLAMVCKELKKLIIIPVVKKSKYIIMESVAHGDFLTDTKFLPRSTKLGYIFAIFKMIRLESVFAVMQPYLHFVNRKMVKNPIMTYFYGSSILTRCDAYRDSFVEQCIAANVHLTDTDLKNFRRFSTYIDHRLRTWIANTLPEARLLYKTFNYVCKSKLFVPKVLTHHHITWLYAPHEQVKYVKTIDYKNHSLSKYTDSLDYKKLASGFLANYIQSKDAIICSKVVAYLAERKIPVLSTHDCWKVPYHFAEELNNAILYAYTEFYQENHLETDFKDTLMYTTLQTIRENNKDYDLTTFESAEFNIQTMVKF